MSKMLFSGVVGGVMINRKAACASCKRPAKLGYWHPRSWMRLILAISAVTTPFLHRTEIPDHVSPNSLEVSKLWVLQPLTLRETLGKMPPLDHVDRLQPVTLPVRLLLYFRLFQVHAPAGRAASYSAPLMNFASQDARLRTNLSNFQQILRS